MSEPETIILSTDAGYVKGFYEGGFLRFLGVPYARADRFEEPVRKRWNGVLDCTVYGPMAYQDISDQWPGAPKISPEELDEECLNLNIYIPRTARAGMKLPVLLEIHGGAFQNGSNRERTPESVVGQDMVIYVSVNYRLGVLGFLPVGELFGEEDFEDSGNLGILDLMAAVRWVYQNIGYFGGDPEQITVLGSSAGAKAIGAMMMNRAFDQMVSQLILSSGATQSIRSLQTANKVRDGYLKLLADMREELPSITDEQKQFLDRFAKGADETKTEADRLMWKDILLQMPAAELMLVQRALIRNGGGTCTFGPVADGKEIPENWQRLAKQGTSWSGRAMIGCSRNEQGILKVFIPDFYKHAADEAEKLFGKNAELAKQEFAALVKKYESETGNPATVAVLEKIWSEILSDYMYRTYSYRLAERLYEKECKVWQYSVELEPAYHVFDVGMAFGGIMPALFPTKELRNRATEVGRVIRRSFMNFILYGNPGAADGIKSPEEEILQEWKPLSVRNWKQMYWDVSPHVDDIPEKDVLDIFPEDVFVL